MSFFTQGFLELEGGTLLPPRDRLTCRFPEGNGYSLNAVFTQGFHDMEGGTLLPPPDRPKACAALQRPHRGTSRIDPDLLDP